MTRMKKQSEQIRTLVLAAFFAAVTCVTTLLHIPTVLGGYIHTGDAFLLLGAFLLGPWWGAAAAGIGSVLAEVFSGSLIYAPGTLVIKVLMALVAALILRHGRHPLPAAIVGSVLAELLMVFGYFLYNGWVIGYGIAAAAAIPTDLIQAAFGAVVSVVLFSAVRSRTNRSSGER